MRRADYVAAATEVQLTCHVQETSAPTWQRHHIINMASKTLQFTKFTDERQRAKRRRNMNCRRLQITCCRTRTAVPTADCGVRKVFGVCCRLNYHAASEGDQPQRPCLQVWPPPSHGGFAAKPIPGHSDTARPPAASQRPTHCDALFPWYQFCRNACVSVWRLGCVDSDQWYVQRWLTAGCPQGGQARSSCKCQRT